MSTPLTRKPGEFKAFCRTARWVDVADVLAADPVVEGAFPERWNRKLARSEMSIPCAFETTDRAAYEAHMAEVHGRKLGQLPADSGRWVAKRAPLPVRMWKAPRLKAEGQPISDREGATQECATCGLVAEVKGEAGTLWWAEHVRGCALAVSA